MRRTLEDARALHELAEEARDDGGPRRGGARPRTASEREVAALEFQRMLSGPHDAAGAIVEVKSGAGGVEAMDWAAMLYRMYTRYCERKGWAVEPADLVAGEEAGISQASFIVRGDHAYGFLKAERGVHRLVRISPFDQNARRQTSFAAVDVTPEIDDDIVIDIKEADVRIDTYRSSGAGGQKVNKTDSAVRITHLAHRHRGGGAERAQPAEEPARGLEDPALAPLRARGAEARSGARRRRGPEEGHRLRLADPQLRAPALPDGEGPAHRGRDGQGGATSWTGTWTASSSRICWACGGRTGWWTSRPRRPARGAGGKAGLADRRSAAGRYGV